MSVEVVLKNIFVGTGEGPHWDEETNTLHLVDLADPNHPNGRIFRWNTQKVEVYSFENKFVTSVVPTSRDPKNEVIITLDHEIGYFNWQTKAFKKLAEVEKGKKTRFNDGKCDSKGRLWTGTMSLEKRPAEVYEVGSGALYSFSEKSGVGVHDKGITISNGLAWNKEDTRMYYIDSYPRMVYAYDFNREKGELSNKTVLKDFSKLSVEEYGFPDGCCTDENGNLWVALYYAGKVVCLDTKHGEILKEINFPVKRITSVCFGGKNLDILYVTSGVYGLSDEEFEKHQPLAGSLFKVTNLNAKGLVPNKFVPGNN